MKINKLSTIYKIQEGNEKLIIEQKHKYNTFELTLIKTNKESTLINRALKELNS